MKHVIILIIGMMWTGIAYAQLTDTPTDDQSEYTEDTYTAEEPTYNTVDPSTLPATKDYSAERLTVRKFDNKKWKDVVGTTDYDEQSERNKSAKNGGNSSDNKGRQRIEQGDEEDDEEAGQTYTIGPWAGTGLQIFFYGVIIAIILAILYFIIKNISPGAGRKVTPDELTDIPEHVENIADLDIDMLLQKAAGNYRLAIRLYFLGLLKKLNEGGFIAWKKDKTNRDYLTEVYTKALYYEDIRKLTLAYEQIWYGDHAISIDRYHQLRDEFKTIDQNLNVSIDREKK